MKIRFSLALVIVIIAGLGIGVGAGVVQERMNGGPGEVASAAQNGGSSNTQDQNGGQGAFGTVQSVSANGFVLSSQNGQVQVATTKDTKITKTVDIKVADLKVGDEVSIRGQQQADGSLSAASIQVGAAGAVQALIGGMGGQGQQGGNRSQYQGNGQSQGSGQNQGNGSGSGGNRGQGSPQGGAQGAFGQGLNGTIESIDGSTITVKTQAGASSKAIASDSTTVRKAADGALSDIQVGETVVVVGDRKSDGTITATSVQLMPAGTGQPNR